MRRSSLTWLGVAVLAAILAASGLATLAAVRDGRDETQTRRVAIADPAIRTLAADVAQSSASLEDLRAFFEASQEVSADDFGRFAAAPLARQPSLGQLDWMPVVGGASFRAQQPGTSSTASMPSPSVAQAAMDAARDQAVPRMTAPFTTPDGERVVVLVVAVYAPGALIGTVEERRAALRGFVGGVLRLAALGESAQTGLPAGASIEVRDGDAVVVGGRERGDVAGTIDVAGRRWTVGLVGVGGSSVALPITVGAAGLLLAAVVALLFVESARRERAARDELARLRVRHDLILASAGDGIIGVDGDGRVGFVNPAAARILGWTVEELTGRRLDDEVLPSLASALRNGRMQSGEQTLRRRDGSTFAGECTMTPIAVNEVAMGAVVTFRDVTARKRVETQTLENLAAAEELAAVDPLTGLANHRTFHERLRVEVARARRNGRGLALVLMDFDHFKRVNDIHGHQAGDRVLGHAATVLEQETRTGELVARVGGEEFALILPEADEDEAVRAAERIRRAIAAATFPDVGTMTISAGVCDMSQASDADTLYRLADGALYWAKHQGRDMVLRYSPEAAQALSARDQADSQERRQALVSIRLLARVVDAKNPSTRNHSQRVGDLCAELAGALGWPPERSSLLREAGSVHDVGKIGVPDALIVTAARLSPEEIETVRKHATVGARIVSEALTDEQVAWVRGHHERWDGNGYPDALKAEDCPEGARIMALADAWDVMTSERPYSTVAYSSADAIRECRAHAGTQFWPRAVEALARLKGHG